MSQQVKMAEPCRVCNGYYPGTCTCFPCKGGKDGGLCDACKEQLYLESDEYGDEMERQEAEENECSACGLDLREAACRDYPDCQDWID